VIPPPGGDGAHTGCAESEAHEGLLLMRAFLRLKNPQRRASLIKQAEMVADAED
jgi:hypothetical protein